MRTQCVIMVDSMGAFVHSARAACTLQGEIGDFCYGASLQWYTETQSWRHGASKLCLVPFTCRKVSMAVFTI